MTHVLYILLILILSMLFVTGCVDTNDSYAYSHQIINTTAYDDNINHVVDPYCPLYTERLTVIGKNAAQINPARFSAESSYVIAVKEDDLERSAVNFNIFTKIKENTTQTLVEQDRIHCGYTYHKIEIVGVIP